MFAHKPRKRYRVEHMKAGYQGWRDTTTIRRPNLIKLLTAIVLVIFLCGAISGAGFTAFSFINTQSNPSVIAHTGGGLHFIQ